MPTLSGPLHSASAWQSYGQTIIFQRTRRGTRAIKHNAPGSDRKSATTSAQATVRARTKTIMTAWPTLSALEKATWNAPAAHNATQPINEFQRTNYARLARGASLTRSYPPPAPHPAYRLTTAGTPAPNPDCTGEYDQTGTHNGQPLYKRQTGTTYYLYWSPTKNAWLLSHTLIDNPSSNYWSKSGTADGPYTAVATNTGQPIVSTEVPQQL